MELAPLVVLAAMVWTGTAFIKHLVAKSYEKALTLVAITALGVLVAFLARASDFAGGIDVGGLVLADLNVASTVIFGYAITSTLRATYEFKKAFDSSDSAAETPMFKSG